jgi:2-polyprenyl-6-methoxyphenol hydroxylase-like FAD-dependent oxidoreductase
MGDAAHVHSPAGGQGMNTGIVDAIVLGRLLADVATGAREEAAIDLYQALRQPAAAQVIGIADRLTTMATMQSPLKRLLRNALLRVVGSLPFLKRRIAMGLSGLGRAALAEVPPIPMLSALAPLQRREALWMAARRDDPCARC